MIEAGDKADIKPGNALALGRIPVGTNVHNIEMHPGRGGQMCRAAGTYAQLVGRTANTSFSAFLPVKCARCLAPALQR